MGESRFAPKLAYSATLLSDGARRLFKWGTVRTGGSKLMVRPLSVMVGRVKFAGGLLARFHRGQLTGRISRSKAIGGLNSGPFNRMRMKARRIARFRLLRW